MTHSLTKLLALAAAAAVGLAFGSAAMAQPAPPQIGYACPAGGRQGTTIHIDVGGQRMNNLDKVYISGPGVQGTVQEVVRPLTPKQAQELRNTIQELRKKPRDPEIAKEIAEINRKLMAFAKRANPAIADVAAIELRISADAPLGRRELRVAGPGGLSNPIVFYVGDLPEFVQKEAADDEFGQFAESMLPAPARKVTGADCVVMLPAVVNGQLMPGKTDRFRFWAEKGQRIVVAVKARDLIPYLADAVPGWFQAVVSLNDANGCELAFDDDYRFHPDPVLCYQIPYSGGFDIQIHDSIYRGREDFVYRISVGQLPFVTSSFPLGGRLGQGALVDVAGWNLPVPQIQRDGKDPHPGVFPLIMPGRELISSPAMFSVDTLPECLAQKGNSSPTSAQKVTLPVIVNGRVEQAGQWHVFRFDGRAGQEIVAEVVARRLDSPLDSVLRLTDEAGKQLAYNDDHDDPAAGLETHHADSYLTATLPADGSYLLYLGDVQNKGGPEYAYRLRISPPRPDFELRVVPSSITVRGGASAPITVHAVRRDGFTGEIKLWVKTGPDGFKLDGATVPAGQDSVRLTLTVPAVAHEDPVAISIEGSATVAGKALTHEAVPADDMMQAFAYRHLVPAQELRVFVSGRNMSRNAIAILSTTPLHLSPGGTAELKVGVPEKIPLGEMELELNQPPDGIAIEKTIPGRFATRVILSIDKAKCKPGLAGNLIFNAFAMSTPTTAPATAPASVPTTAPASSVPTPTPSGKPAATPFAKPGKTSTSKPATATSKPATTTASSQPAPERPPPPPAPRKIPVGTLPAIPFEIVQP